MHQDTNKAPIGGNRHLFKRPGWIKGDNKDQSEAEFFRRSHLIKHQQDPQHRVTKHVHRPSLPQTQQEHLGHPGICKSKKFTDGDNIEGTSADSLTAEALQHTKTPEIEEQGGKTTLSKDTDDAASNNFNKCAEEALLEEGNAPPAISKTQNKEQADLERLPSASHGGSIEDRHITESSKEDAATIETPEQTDSSTATQQGPESETLLAPPDMVLSSLEQNFNDAVLQILVTSPIPGSRPLILARKISQRLRDVRLTWFMHQGLPEHMKDSIFLTWKGKRLFDVTSCRSLGVEVDDQNRISWRGSELSTENGQIHMEAMTAQNLESLRTSRLQTLLAEPEEDLSSLHEVEATSCSEKDSSLTIILRAKDISECQMKVKKVFESSLSLMMCTCANCTAFYIWSNCPSIS